MNDSNTNGGDPEIARLLRDDWELLTSSAAPLADVALTTVRSGTATRSRWLPRALTAAAALAMIVAASAVILARDNRESIEEPDAAVPTLGTSPIASSPGASPNETSPSDGEYFGGVRGAEIRSTPESPLGSVTVRVVCESAREYGSSTAFFFDRYEPVGPTYFDATGPEVDVDVAEQRWADAFPGYDATVRLDGLVPPGRATLRVSCDELGGGYPIPISVPDFSGFSWYTVEPAGWDIELLAENDPSLDGTLRVGHPLKARAVCPSESDEQEIVLAAFPPEAVDDSREGRLYRGAPITTIQPSETVRIASGQLEATWSITTLEAWVGNVELQVACAGVSSDGIAAAYYRTDTFHYSLSVVP